MRIHSFHSTVSMSKSESKTFPGSYANFSVFHSPLVKVLILSLLPSSHFAQVSVASRLPCSCCLTLFSSPPAISFLSHFVSFLIFPVFTKSCILFNPSQEALEGYFKVSIFVWDCEHCGSTHACHQQSRILSAPPILIIHLSR